MVFRVSAFGFALVLMRTTFTPSALRVRATLSYSLAVYRK
jgi:hypothetical protein